MRSTSPWAFARGNGPRTATPESGRPNGSFSVGGGVGTGIGTGVVAVVIGRGVRTVGVGAVTTFVAEGGGVPAAPASAVSMRGCEALTAGGVGSGSAALAATTSTITTAPKPRRTTAAIPPRIHGRAEPPPPPGGLPANVAEGDDPSGAPHDRQ